MNLVSLGSLFSIWFVGLIIFDIGIPSCLFYGVLADFTVSNFLLRVGALLVSIFISTQVSKNELYEDLKQGLNVGKVFFTIWFYLLKYVTPFAIIIVFLDVVGVLDHLISLFN